MLLPLLLCYHLNGRLEKPEMTPKTDEMIKIGKKGLDLSIFPAWRRSPET
jgi:hypothetical protein